MSLRVLVTYLPDDRLTDVPTIEIKGVVYSLDGVLSRYGGK